MNKILDQYREVLWPILFILVGLCVLAIAWKKGNMSEVDMLLGVGPIGIGISRLAGVYVDKKEKRK